MKPFPLPSNNLFTESYIYQSKILDISTIEMTFPKWEGEPFNNSFGKKPLLNLEGIPMFAEFAIQTLTSVNGWSSRWISTYAALKDKPRFLSEWVDKPISKQAISPIDDEQANNLLQRIATRNGNNYSGYWDVFAWNKSNYLFLEAKRSKKDKISN